MPKIIGRGAEAIIYLDKNVIKDRIKKSYRIPEIDNKLRKSRTKREAKIFTKLENIKFPAPKLISTDEKEKIEMSYIKGDKLRDVLTKDNYKELMKELGEKIAILHNNGIIHGDLTTSNFILNKEIYFIDFGLSFFDEHVEHKAVDLHLLKQALESKHYQFWEDAFKQALEGYKKAKDYKEVMTRFESVEKRGRYKQKSAKNTKITKQPSNKSANNNC